MAGVTAARRWLAQHGRVSERPLAETFAKDFDSRWRYNEDEGYWLQWVGTHWARKQTPEFLDAVGKFAAIFADGFRRIDAITHAEAVKLQSQRTVSALERICRSLPSFLARSVLFDANAFLLGTPGGTVDLRTGKMQKADPDDYITVLTPVTPAPEGTPLGPKFKNFLAAITGSDDDFIKTLQQWFGISAEGTSRDQKILFLYGEGGNGKGVLLRTVAGLLGDHAVNAPRDLLMVQKNSQHPTALVDVVHSRMAMATEVDDDATWDTALVKDLTGGDPISVRRMRQDFYRTTARCSITISGNKKPALKGIDDAVRRRFLVATFKLKLEDKDVIPDLEKVFDYGGGAGDPTVDYRRGGRARGCGAAVRGQGDHGRYGRLFLLKRTCWRTSSGAGAWNRLRLTQTRCGRSKLKRGFCHLEGILRQFWTCFWSTEFVHDGG